MNQFLASLEITFRRDPTNFRPRVNKMNSVKDKEQKGASRLFGVIIVARNKFLCSKRQLFLPRVLVAGISMLRFHSCCVM